MSYGSTEDSPLHYKERQPPYNPAFRRHSNENEIEVETGTTSQLCHIVHEEPYNSTPIGTIGLLVALSIHAALEGLAVGLEGSASKVLFKLSKLWKEFPTKELWTTCMHYNHQQSDHLMIVSYTIIKEHNLVPS